MEPDAYLEMAAVQNSHWWFLARRAILAEIIGGLSLPTPARILEIGCGMGGNLALLQQFGLVTAVESDGFARDWTKQQFGLDVLDGALPDRLPLLPDKFQLVCLLDVLEHVDADVKSLAAVIPFLDKGGRVLVTVPAYNWLWSDHDVKLHHRRRYTRTELLKTATAAGLIVTHSGYFNTILFPLAAVTRLLAKAIGSRPLTGSRVPPSFVNRFLTYVFSAEVSLVRRIRLPFGLSVFAVLQREAA